LSALPSGVLALWALLVLSASYQRVEHTRGCYLAEVWDSSAADSTWSLLGIARVRRLAREAAAAESSASEGNTVLARPVPAAVEVLALAALALGGLLAWYIFTAGGIGRRVGLEEGGGAGVEARHGSG
jgi:hypothetical protein